MKDKIKVVKVRGGYNVEGRGGVISGPFDTRTEAMKDKKSFEAELAEMEHQPPEA